MLPKLDDLCCGRSHCSPSFQKPTTFTTPIWVDSDSTDSHLTLYQCLRYSSDWHYLKDLDPTVSGATGNNSIRPQVKKGKVPKKNLNSMIHMALVQMQPDISKVETFRKFPSSSKGEQLPQVLGLIAMWAGSCHPCLLCYTHTPIYSKKRLHGSEENFKN